jgi:DNA-binding transcriptional ArsR family regulator
MHSAPPGFLRLAGHPLRWRLLTELARTDRQVRELTGLLGQPQSLVSYHLGQLRAGGLVSARRSSADGRDCYYRIELARCRERLAETGLALHPGLGPGPQPALFKGALLQATADLEHLRDMASEAPVIRLVNAMIGLAIEKRASDIHIEPFENGRGFSLRALAARRPRQPSTAAPTNRTSSPEDSAHN